MSSNTLPLCPRCGRPVQTEDAAFCAFCGAPIRSMQGETPEGACRMLNRAEEMKDPVRKHALLCEAQKQYPDCLAVEEALLFLGRLHERDARKIDFSVIKSYLWHMYLTPQQFNAQQTDAMRAELTGHPQLQKCLSLAPDADVFMRHYLEKLAADFVNLFLKGSTHYSRTLFGFRMDSRMGKILSSPMAAMLGNIQADSALTNEHRAMMYDALYRAFLSEVNGDSQWVDALLREKGLPVPVK